MDFSGKILADSYSEFYYAVRWAMLGDVDDEKFDSTILRRAARQLCRLRV